MLIKDKFNLCTSIYNTEKEGFEPHADLTAAVFQTGCDTITHLHLH